MGNAALVTKIFLVTLMLKSLVEAWLESKNKNHIYMNRDEVPEKFKEKITLEEHQKAADYSLAKIRLGRALRLLNLFILLGWTLGGGLEWLDNKVSQYALDQIAHGVTFFAAFGLISTLLDLPQSIYSTFILEEKFGFNKTTPKLFIIDTIKGLVLGALIALPLLAAMLWIMGKMGANWWIYAWLFFTAVQFTLLWAYPRFIAPLFNKFSPLEEGEVKNKVLGLLERTGFKSNGLFVMNASIRSSHGNAYFTGFGKNKRIVFFDTLINSLNPEEVEAVLAHELGHFKKKHITKQLIRSTVTTLVGLFILSRLMIWPDFFLGHGSASAGTHMALVLFSMVAGIYTFFLTPLFSWISRKYEFEADEFASQHANPNDLISALVKLYKDNASTLTPDPTYSAYYHSHPPALIRVNHLEQLSAAKN
jgi:STE24 endopeptidase